MSGLTVLAGLRGNDGWFGRTRKQKPAPAGLESGLSTTRVIVFDQISLEVCAISHSPAEMRDEQQFMLEKYAIAANLPIDAPFVKHRNARND
jgi:hypothetical protein